MITLAFVSKGSGRGEVRAQIHGTEPAVLVVGDYARDAGTKTWGARLYATVGDSSFAVGELHRPTLTRLRAAATHELRKGEWWK
jgi:hypothetical protein